MDLDGLIPQCFAFHNFKSIRWCVNVSTKQFPFLLHFKFVPLPRSLSRAVYAQQQNVNVRGVLHIQHIPSEWASYKPYMCNVIIVSVLYSLCTITRNRNKNWRSCHWPRHFDMKPTALVCDSIYTQFGKSLSFFGFMWWLGCAFFSRAFRKWQKMHKTTTTIRSNTSNLSIDTSPKTHKQNLIECRWTGLTGLYLYGCHYCSPLFPSLTPPLFLSRSLSLFVSLSPYRQHGEHHWNDQWPTPKCNVFLVISLWCQLTTWACISRFIAIFKFSINVLPPKKHQTIFIVNNFWLLYFHNGM